MAGGEFFRASGVEEALALLARYEGKAQVLAGGTDVMVKVNRRLLSPEALIYIGDAGLSYIREQDAQIVIGAATPLADIVGSPLVQQKLPLLAQAVRSIGSPAVRNSGTLGGNLANASPAADSAVALLALGASLKLVSQQGQRTIDCASFFTGPGQTVLKPSELLQEIIVPVPAASMRWGYRKLGRRQADTLSVVSAAVCAEMAAGRCSWARIALGAVAPTPLLAKAASLLAGQAPSPALIERVAKAVAEETSPIDDVRASAWYRRQATEALVKGLLGRIAE